MNLMSQKFAPVLVSPVYLLDKEVLSPAASSKLCSPGLKSREEDCPKESIRGLPLP
jgi:hypothetical protein